MRCSTMSSTTAPGDEPCEKTATHLLIGSTPGDEGMREASTDPVCKPCGESYTRRPALKARIVPLHVHMPQRAFLEIVEGHRLLKDPAHEARCYDCGTTGTPTWFRFQTNGCPGRPESITVLRYSRETLQSFDRPALAARLWWDYAVDYLGMPVEDWRPVTDHADYSAYFTFRDREYAIRYNLLGFRFGAVKLPNRGRPAPVLINAEDQDTYKQVVFHFHGMVNQYESTYFATWTPNRQDVILHAPEGQIRAVLRLTDLQHPAAALAEITEAVGDAFGAISDITFKDRLYGETE